MQRSRRRKLAKLAAMTTADIVARDDRKLRDALRHRAKVVARMSPVSVAVQAVDQDKEEKDG